MGITIHYTGKINHISQIKPLTEEVMDICQSLDWKYDLFDMDFAIGGFLIEETEDTPVVRLKGLTFTPPGSEAFNFLFTKNGSMANMMKILTNVDAENVENGHWLSTKTQFAGYEIHIAVSKLLKYLSGKYMEEFEVEDEVKTKDIFQQYTTAIKTFANALENAEVSKATTKESLIQQIENILEALRKKGEL